MAGLYPLCMEYHILQSTHTDFLSDGLLWTGPHAQDTIGFVSISTHFNGMHLQALYPSCNAGKSNRRSSARGNFGAMDQLS
jgi:hypothetical protein